MATSERRLLIWKLQKKLPGLGINQLQTVAREVINTQGEHAVDASTMTEPELFDVIVDFLRSDRLRDTEDEGMSTLMFLFDMVEGLLAAMYTDHTLSEDEDVDGQPDVASPTHIRTSTSRGEVDGAQSTSTVPARSTTSARDPVKGVRVSTSSYVSDQVVRLTDVASLLTRREFKIHGGQLSDTGSEISYNSLCKQIDDGLKEGFSESEVIRTVIKVTKQGNFREMLTNKDDLTVDELKRFLRSHIREKSSTELFHELSNAKQQDKETPQQFMYRIMGLKQRILSASQQSETEFSYDKRLVQGTFLHTLYQGLNEKNIHIRTDIKLYLRDLKATDDFLLEQITRSASEEADRLKRLGAVTKSKPVTVSSAQQGDNRQADHAKLAEVNRDIQANQTAIMELTAQLSTLTQHLNKLTTKTDSETPRDLRQPQISIQTGRTDNKGRCSQCVQQGNMSCSHCFRCGQAGHRAVGCLKRPWSGNGVQSLERGSQ